MKKITIEADDVKIEAELIASPTAQAIYNAIQGMFKKFYNPYSSQISADKPADNRRSSKYCMPYLRKSAVQSAYNLSA